MGTKKGICHPTMGSRSSKASHFSYHGQVNGLGRQHGYGTHTWASGDRYEGQWRNGCPHGEGLFIGANGDRHEGQYFDGKRHGYGTFFWNDGDTYAGQWNNGQMHGEGVFTR